MPKALQRILQRRATVPVLGALLIEIVASLRRGDVGLDIVAALSMTGALAGLLIDFQFYAAAASANMGSKGNASFFANFYILLNFSSLLLQLFLTPKIQDRVGLRGGLMVLPMKGVRPSPPPTSTFRRNSPSSARRR